MISLWHAVVVLSSAGAGNLAEIRTPNTLFTDNMVHALVTHRVNVIDSHTAGEPTRCVVAGGPDLGSAPLAERLKILRRTTILSPRHSLRAARLRCAGWRFLVEPVDPACAAGVIFFNNAGYLGMCGHGAIGVAVTLAHMGRIEPGEHALETPVGVVQSAPPSANRRHHSQCARIPSSRRALRCRCLVMARSPAMWPGAATGFSWSATIRCELDVDQVEP